MVPDQNKNKIRFSAYFKMTRWLSGFQLSQIGFLYPVGRNEVDLTIHVSVRATRKSMGNAVVW
jgi:hypothetical protein